MAWLARLRTTLLWGKIIWNKIRNDAVIEIVASSLTHVTHVALNPY